MPPISLQLAERKLLLVFGDVLLLNIATLAGLWLGALRSGWDFSGTFLWQKGYWFAGLTTLYLLLAAANNAYNPRVTSDLAAGFLALGLTIGQMLLLYLVVYFMTPPYSLPRHVIAFFGVIFSLLMLGWRWLYGVVLTMRGT